MRRLLPPPWKSDLAAFPLGQDALRLSLAYLSLYLLLDWVSYLWPLGAVNITPWNPQPGLAVALLLWQPRWWWLVASGLLLTEVGIRGQPDIWGLSLTVSLVMTAAYAAVAWLLRSRVLHSPALTSLKELMRFTVAVAAASAVHACLYVFVHAQGSRELTAMLDLALLRYWIGDAVGILVLLPGLLMLMEASGRRSLAVTARDPAIWVTAIVIGLLVAAVFLLERREQINLFFVLLLPVVAAAARHGLAGAVLASGVTQLGLILGGQALPGGGLDLVEMQGLMAAIAMAGLTLGVAVDEQARADARWRSGARMAAAGQMTASIAHELGQPLTALAGYARACRMLSEQVAHRDPRLETVAQHIEREALRAGDILQRLRSFFTQGQAQRHPVRLHGLLTECAAQAQTRAVSLGVSLQLQIQPASRAAWVMIDPVQIAVVLRNLIDNGLEAARAGQQTPARLSVHADLRDHEAHIEVVDSGAGISRQRLERVFEPGASDKPDGMGIGLSLCRAIVDAHGGRLWAEEGPPGRLHLTLPLADVPDAADAPDPAAPPSGRGLDDRVAKP